VNVWKAEIKEGEEIEKRKVAILEAMKLEIPVRAEEDTVGSTVEKLLARPGEVIEAGKPLMLLRKAN
jgi:urea carboxylase